VTTTPIVLGDSARRGGTTFEAAYARDVGPSPLEALSPFQPVSVASMAVADLTGDGFDDIVITGDVASTKGVSVIPVHSAAPAQTLIADATCGP
jgi:hypothetical protein